MISKANRVNFGAVLIKPQKKYFTEQQDNNISRLTGIIGKYLPKTSFEAGYKRHILSGEKFIISSKQGIDSDKFDKGISSSAEKLFNLNASVIPNDADNDVSKKLDIELDKLLNYLASDPQPSQEGMSLKN